MTLGLGSSNWLCCHKAETSVLWEFLHGRPCCGREWWWAVRKHWGGSVPALTWDLWQNISALLKTHSKWKPSELIFSWLECTLVSEGGAPFPWKLQCKCLPRLQLSMGFGGRVLRLLGSYPVTRSVVREGILEGPDLSGAGKSCLACGGFESLLGRNIHCPGDFFSFSIPNIASGIIYYNKSMS